MPQILKLAQLVEQHGMPQMQVRRGGIETGLDSQRSPFLELGHQRRLDQQLVRTALDELKRLAYI